MITIKSEFADPNIERDLTYFVQNFNTEYRTTHDISLEEVLDDGTSVIASSKKGTV
jgi:hypothetical protein